MSGHSSGGPRRSGGGNSRRSPDILRADVRAAYGTALSANLVSASLTFVYVPAGAVELNPVVRWLIAVTGAAGMFLVKSAVVVASYWGFALGSRVVAPPVVRTFAWVGALVHVADAVHDVKMAVVATLAGVVPPVDLPALAAVAVIAVVGAVVLRPRVALLAPATGAGADH